MQVISAIFAAAFLALLLTGAFLVGATLLVIIIATGAVSALLFAAYGAWQRWRFVHSATQAEGNSRIIEVDYTEISSRDIQGKDPS